MQFVVKRLLNWQPCIHTQIKFLLLNRLLICISEESGVFTMYKNRTENFHTSTESFPITLRVEDLMPILNVGRNTAYQLVRSGEIRSIKIGRQIRIPRQVLLDYLGQK